MCPCGEISRMIRTGMDDLNRGNPESAARKLRAALARAHTIGSDVHRAKIRANLALVQRQRGKPEMARRQYELALKTVEARFGRDVPLWDRIHDGLKNLNAA